MSTNLESYISSNRSQLDTAIPDDEIIWKGISARLDRKKQTHSILRKSAALILMLLTVGTVTLYSVNHSLRSHPPQLISLRDISPALGQEEKEYRQELFDKMDQLKGYTLTPSQATELYKELHQINLQYDACFTDLQQMGNNPKVIRGLIRCYEQKIKILENTMREIEKNQPHETNVP